MNSRLDDFSADVRDAIRGARWADGLAAVTGFVRLINSDPAGAGQIYESRELDRLCIEIGGGMAAGDTWPAPGRAEGDRETQVYVASELYEAGGHTRVIEDFIAAQPRRRHIVLLTDPHGRGARERAQARFAAPNVAVEWAPGHDSAEKVRWLAGWLLAFAEARVFLFIHHEDAIAVAACAATRPRRLHFYHHADHHLALGLHLPGSTHLDLTPFSFFHCRDAIGLGRVVHLPLTTPDVEARSPDVFRHDAGGPDFLTCACGNEGKFSAPYDFSYFDMIPALLARTGGTHAHIGPLGEAAMARLAGELEKHGVAAARFRHVPHVPLLSGALDEMGVSLFLGSWPIGGARAQLEALSNGTPILGHVNYAHEYLGVQCLLPPGMPVWRTPEEFFRMIGGLSADELRRLARVARAHWEKFHSGSKLGEWLAGDEISSPGDPPPQPAYEPDRLRTWLGTGSDGLDLREHAKMLARAEERCRTATAKLEKERARRQRLEEICARLRTERLSNRRGLAERLRQWWNRPDAQKPGR